MKLKVTVLLLVTSVLCSGNLWAKNTYFRTLSYDSSYLPTEMNSNRGITRFNMEYMGLVPGGLFDLGTMVIPKKMWILRLIYVNAFNIAVSYFGLYYPLLLANHEFGHGARTIAEGYVPGYDFQSGSRLDNYFLYFGMAHARIWSGGSSAAVRSYTNEVSAPTDYGLAVTAGGVNQSMYLAEAIGERIYYYNGHVAMIPYYITTKLDLASYISYLGSGNSTLNGNGDPEVVQSYYQGRGHSIDYNDMRLGNYISILGSATTYAFIFRTAYVRHADPAVYPLQVGSVRLPDTLFYLNRSGISYKVNTGFRWGRSPQITVPLSYEQTVEGDQQRDIISGVHLNFRRFTVGTRLVLGFGSRFGFGIGGAVESDVRLNRHFMLSAGAEYYNSNTLHGERYIFRVTGGQTASLDVWGRLSYVF